MCLQNAACFKAHGLTPYRCASPSQTACARVLVPKDWRLLGQPASISCFYSSLIILFHSRVDARFGCDWTPLCWCLACSPGWSDLNVGQGFVIDGTRIQNPPLQAPFAKDSRLGYRCGLPSDNWLYVHKSSIEQTRQTLTSIHPLPSHLASYRRSQSTGNVRSRFQG